MGEFRQQGSCILLRGPHGTGKTMTAKWISKKIKRGFKQLSAASIGGGEPGESERKVIEFFADCKKRNNATIFIDECDHLLMDRDSMEGASLTWQLGTIETMMMQLNVYTGFVIMATNKSDKLEPALVDRFLAVITIGRPDYESRKLLWKQKIPEKFPFQPTEKELAIIAKFDLTGRQIENVIVNVAQDAICRVVKPSYKSVLKFCGAELAKHLKENE